MKQQQVSVKLPPIVGEQSLNLYRDAKRLLRHSRQPLSFVGPTGTGKTLIGLHLLRWYEKKFNVPSFYVQMNPDISRATLIGGHRMISGSLVPVKGPMMLNMDQGGIMFIDEFTHAEPDDQASTNSALSNDRIKISSLVGEVVSEARDSTRFILAHNPLNYLANYPMPLSLRRRLYAFEVKFPSFAEEVQIARAIMFREAPRKVPTALLHYLTHLARSARQEEAPICASNVASAALALGLEHYARRKEDLIDVEELFLLPEGSGSEAVLRGVYEAIYQKPAQGTTDLNDKAIRKVVMYIAQVTQVRFQSIVLSAFMGPYLPEKSRAALTAAMPNLNS